MMERVAVATDVLSRAKRLVDPALVAQLQTLHPDLRRAAEYHLGYVEADGTPAAGAGKGVRPASRCCCLPRPSARQRRSASRPPWPSS